MSLCAWGCLIFQTFQSKSSTLSMTVLERFLHIGGGLCCFFGLPWPEAICLLVSSLIYSLSVEGYVIMETRSGMSVVRCTDWAVNVT